MKVELDLSTEQLQQLDNNLTDLLVNLTETQKIEILKNYFIYQFDKLERTYTNSWGSTCTEVSNFGKKIIQGLQEQITESITNEIIQDKNLLKSIEETKQYIIKHLTEITEDAINQYIINNLFNNKNELRSEIRQQLWDMKNNH